MLSLMQGYNSVINCGLCQNHNSIAETSQLHACAESKIGAQNMLSYKMPKLHELFQALNP